MEVVTGTQLLVSNRDEARKNPDGSAAVDTWVGDAITIEKLLPTFSARATPLLAGDVTMVRDAAAELKRDIARGNAPPLVRP